MLSKYLTAKGKQMPTKKIDSSGFEQVDVGVAGGATESKSIVL